MSAKPVISHSQISSWRGCRKAWEYSYRQELVSKRIERPLYFGSWFHKALETMYDPAIGSWKVGHAEYTAQYNKVFQEERDRLDRGKSKKAEGAEFEPLPQQIERLIRSYRWYYRKRNERTIAVEVPFHLDRGFYTLHGVIDRIYEDLDDGLIWVEDHKTVDDLPDESAFHTMDPQLTYYLEGARIELGIDAAGIEFNYIRSVAPSIPSLTQTGAVSRAAITTDYPTLYRFLKANGFEPQDYSDLLVPLAQLSPLLRRYRLTRVEAVTTQVLANADQSAREIIAHEALVRSISRSCNWCSFAQVCRGDLYGIDTTQIRKQQFTTRKEKARIEAKRKLVTQSVGG